MEGAMMAVNTILWTRYFKLIVRTVIQQSLQSQIRKACMCRPTWRRRPL